MPEGLVMTPGVAERVAARFPEDVAGHEMTVLRDDGLYRHMRFKRPETGMYWFDLVTWPGHLAITGDMGSFTFARDRDMFEFFGYGSVSYDYWAQKVIASSGHREYSPERFKERVKREFDDAREAHEAGIDASPHARAGHGDRWDRIWSEIEDEVLSCAHDGEGEAYRSLYDWNTHANNLDFSFCLDDWDLQEFTFQYLWCCRAIKWGIERYGRAAGEQGE